MLITGNVKTREVFIGGEKLDPKPSQELMNHSPDGFMWGYGGSGPAQLALAILLRVAGKTDALRFYQDFKWAFIQGLDQDKDFSIEVSEVQAWLKQAKQSEAGQLP